MAFSLDGDKICEVSGQVKCSSMERMARDFKPGSIALFKLSNSYYVHVVTSSKRVKFQLKTSNGKFDFSWRDSRLTLSIRQNYAKSSSSSDVSLIHLNDATPKQLQLFVESLNAIETHASFKGKLLSRDSDIQDVENKPLNSPKISKVRSKVVSSSSSPSPNRSIISNFHAKQMKPPSSYSTQKTKTPLNDQTRARDNLHNASIFKGSASSFYGSQNSRSPLIQRSGNFGKSLGPRLMPPPQPLRQTPRLSSQISFRSHYKKPFEREVTLTGFSNLGNTCYMNAILQSLLGIPPFVQDLSNLELLDNVHPQCLYKCLYNVMLCKKKCQNAEVIRTSLRKLKRTISEAATRFSGYHQHDAHEFLCQVFDQLRDDVIACKSPLSKCSSDEINSKTNDLLCPVTRTFESKVLHVVSCKRCGETTSNEEIYHAFSIDLPSLCNQSDTSPSSINMQTLIKKHFEDEELEYTCSKCNSKEAVISHGFVRLPRVLILHLKRYGYDNFTEEQEKKEDKVNIERFIALDMMCSSNTEIPLPFLPKSSFQLSPVKSRQKPQKRHFISEDDDDDKDFQASPSTRRKLDHSFGNTIKARSTVDLSSDSKGVSDEEMGITEFCKLDSLNGYNSDVHNASEQNNKDIALENKENTADSHHLANGKPVWEASEELQMEWALAESAKSAEKKPRSDLREQSISVVEVECNENLKSHRAPVPKDSLQRKGECNDEISAFDFDDDFSDFENPVWTRSEEEQVRWALAESAKLSAEKKSVDTLKDEGRKRQRDLTNKLGSQKSLYDNCNFSLENVMSDEDLLGAEWEIHQTSEPRGLKGGGPIVTERGSGGVEHVSFLVNDENRSPQNCADSGLEKKKPPIICIKRRNGYLSRKRKNDSDVLTKTPTLGQFEGNLFESQPRDNRPPSRNSLTPSVSSTGGEKSCGLGFSSKFSDDDMEKAINISLQEQEISNVEDEELRKALELSLRDVERKCPDMEPIPPPVVIDITDSIKGRDSTPQVEGIESSTRSYRLVSIVNHLGSKSTSGHYISDVYDCNTKQWTSYDDSAATKVSEHSVRYKRQQSGYIFFYMYKQCVDAIENSTPSKENVQK